MKHLLTISVLFLTLLSTGCENPLQSSEEPIEAEIIEAAELAFTDNVILSEDKIVLEFAPNRIEPVAYDIKYSIQETGGETANATKTIDYVSQNIPAVITIEDLEQGAEYLVGVSILDKEGNEVHKYQDTLNPWEEKNIDSDRGEGGWQKMSESCGEDPIVERANFKKCLQSFSWSGVGEKTSEKEIQERFIEIGSMKILQNPTDTSIKVFLYQRWAADEEGTLYLLNELG
jgi:hypothetical protein